MITEKFLISKYWHMFIIFSRLIIYKNKHTCYLFFLSATKWIASIILMCQLVRRQRAVLYYIHVYTYHLWPCRCTSETKVPVMPRILCLSNEYYKINLIKLIVCDKFLNSKGNLCKKCAPAWTKLAF